MPKTARIIIPYHHCSLVCKVCERRYMGFDIADSEVTVRCWSGCSAKGELDGLEKIAAQNNQCPECRHSF